MKIFLSFIIFTFVLLFNVFSQDWLTDFDKAKHIAQKDNKYILMIFEGSDWCGPCKAFKRNILSKKHFTEYAKDNLVLIKIDFPKKKENQLPIKQRIHNIKLVKKYNKGGYFPKVILLDSLENIINTSIGYKNVAPEVYVDSLKSYINNKID